MKKKVSAVGGPSKAADERPPAAIDSGDGTGSSDWGVPYAALVEYSRRTREGGVPTSEREDVLDATIAVECVISDLARLLEPDCTGEERTAIMRRLRAARRIYTPAFEARTEREARMRLMKLALASLTADVARSNSDDDDFSGTFYNHLWGAMPEAEFPPRATVNAVVQAMRRGERGARLDAKLYALAKAMGATGATQKSFREMYAKLRV